MKRLRQAVTAAFVLLGMALAYQARADARADELLKKVAAATAAAKTLSGDLRMTGTTTDDAGKLQTIEIKGEVLLARPNYALITRRSTDGPETVYSDGLSTYTLSGKTVYTREPVKPDGQNIDTLWALPIAMFFDPANIRLQGERVETTTYSGTSTLNGHVYRLITITGTKPFSYSGTLLVASNDIVTGMNISSGGITFTANLSNVILGKPLSRSTFAFKAPPGAKLVQPTNNSANLLPAGKRAPALVLSLLDGSKISLARQLNGHRAVIVSFWFADCPPCREELPQLQKLYDEFKVSGLAVITVNVSDTKEAAAKFMKARGLTLPVAIAPDTSAVPEDYGVQACPTIYVIGSGGNVSYSHVGFDEAAIRGALRELGIK